MEKNLTSFHSPKWMYTGIKLNRVLNDHKKSAGKNPTVFLYALISCQLSNKESISSLVRFDKVAEFFMITPSAKALFLS